jgi:hypothetical protein
LSNSCGVYTAANIGVGDTPLGTDTAPIKFIFCDAPSGTDTAPFIVVLPKMGPGMWLCSSMADTAWVRDIAGFSFYIYYGLVLMKVACHHGIAFCPKFVVI